MNRFAIKFIKKTKTKSDFSYLNLTTTLFIEFLAHNNGLFDLDWMFGESKMLTASGDKTTVLWDVVTENKLAVFKGHSSTIKTVRWRHNDQGRLLYFLYFDRK